MLCLLSLVKYNRKATVVFHMVHISLLYYSLYSTNNSDLYCFFLQLSIDIGTEVRYHNKMLDEMVSFVFGWLVTWENQCFIFFPWCCDIWKNNILAIKRSICVISYLVVKQSLILSSWEWLKASYTLHCRCGALATEQGTKLVVQLPEGLNMCWIHWGLNWEPAASQQTEPPPLCSVYSI